MSLVPEYDSDATSGSDAEVEPMPVLTNPAVAPADASSPQLSPPPAVHGSDHQASGDEKEDGDRGEGESKGKEEDYENEGPAAKARKINSGLRSVASSTGGGLAGLLSLLPAPKSVVLGPGPSHAMPAIGLAAPRTTVTSAPRVLGPASSDSQDRSSIVSSSIGPQRYDPAVRIHDPSATCPAEYTTATADRTSAESYPYATVDPAAYQYDYTAYYNGAYPGHGYDQTAIAAPATNDTAADFSLDDEALRKMGGRRALRAGVKLQDISQTAQLHNATTHSPAFQASAPPVGGQASASSSGTTTAPDHLKPSQMQKRKNNIMSLAFQSVENETKIKELYASGRQSKRETQGKYGF
ncbi:hypothetical protein IWQ60_010413 [Tieghemiomyces parasiticus]|uniref:Mitotic checkpoint regulator, MAD2B-interacting-domain-containing protein n=1 Tax=Tieghemiomyces parasiticus TaxID=78921 RepID=A0A9W7ZT32_9FUNG|nr:hypothetical protein IWQ60_010413 [Tieghemiomyces parasiticus]